MGMNTYLSFRFFVLVGILVPGIAFAAPGTFAELMILIIDIVGITIPVIIAGTLVVFFFGLAKTLMAAGDTDTLKEGRSIMAYGVISLFVVVAIWGILGIVHNSLFDGGINTNVDPGIPESIYGNL
jgi:ABC-type antimicrobial peptide transport system permease subunit